MASVIVLLVEALVLACSSSGRCSDSSSSGSRATAAAARTLLPVAGRRFAGFRDSFGTGLLGNPCPLSTRALRPTRLVAESLLPRVHMRILLLPTQEPSEMLRERANRRAIKRLIAK